jgi:hypothetical protein
MQGQYRVDTRQVSVATLGGLVKGDFSGKLCPAKFQRLANFATV